MTIQSNVASTRQSINRAYRFTTGEAAAVCGVSVDHLAAILTATGAAVAS